MEKYIAQQSNRQKPMPCVAQGNPPGRNTGSGVLSAFELCILLRSTGLLSACTRHLHCLARSSYARIWAHFAVRCSALALSPLRQIGTSQTRSIVFSPQKRHLSIAELSSSGEQVFGELSRDHDASSNTPGGPGPEVGDNPCVVGAPRLPSENRDPVPPDPICDNPRAERHSSSHVPRTRWPGRR
jgi:hypothetical protein